jgi:hypothetical protein
MINLSTKSKEPGKKRQPPRFPRLVRGQGAAGLEKLLWMPPHFEVRLEKTKESIATKLIFTLPIPPDFETTLPGLHWLICESLSNEWENAIADGYWKSRYNKRSLLQFIEKGLRHGFRNGVGKFLEEEWDLPDAFYRVQAGQEQREFAEHSGSPTGPRPNARIAFWVAERFKMLILAIKSLRAQFKGNISQSREQELKTAIERVCSYETYVAAFRNLLGRETITPWAIRTKKIHPRAIALAIIEHELPKHGYVIAKEQGSLWKHIQLGNDLIALFDSDPSGPPPASS